jgi:hypothetical protein
MLHIDIINQNIVFNIVAGLLAGLLCACGGAIKDAPYEGFKLLTFFRSPIIGLFCGIVTILFTRNFIIAICCAGYMERVIVEGWKIIRVKKPGKFDVGEWGVAKRLKI